MKNNIVILSTRNLVFKERLVKQLTERDMGLYIVQEVISRNVVKLKPLVSMRIYPVVNISRVVRYREPVKRQKVEELKLVEVDIVKEQKVEKILNIRGNEVFSALEGFTIENDIWEEKEDLENAKKVVTEFEERMEVKVRQQEKIRKKKYRR